MTQEVNWWVLLAIRLNPTGARLPPCWLKVTRTRNLREHLFFSESYLLSMCRW